MHLLKVTRSDLTISTLSDLHNGLYHPRVTQLLYFVITKNLPFFFRFEEDLCFCRVCAEQKSLSYHHDDGIVIKETKRMEQISMEFKESLPIVSYNSFSFSIINEHSQVFHCLDMHKTLVRCLDFLFSLYEMLHYIHTS